MEPKKILIVCLLMICIYHTSSYPTCSTGTSCCSSCTDNCHSSSSCCSTGKSCCSSCTDNCHSSSSCCSTSSCCQPQTEPCRPCPSNPSCPPTTIHPTQPPYTPYPPQPSSPHNSTSINNNYNNITIPTNITIQNEIRSETHITIPVNVSVHNVNNINIESAKSHDIPCTEKITNKSCTDGTVSVPVPYPVPVPVYRHIPVPYAVTVPKYIPVSRGCCQVVQPCTPYTYGGCYTSNVHCSGQCQGQQQVFNPINVCNSGCVKRETATGSFCGLEGCNRGPVDCSQCQGNFYQGYDSFLQCAGCYVPMPWGLGGYGGGQVYNQG